MAGVALIIRSDLDLAALLPITRDMLGYSLAKKADGAAVALSPLVHQLVCLASFKFEHASLSVKDALPYLGLVSVGFLIGTNDLEMAGVLECLHDIEAIVTDTTQRGVQAAIAHGTLAQWQRAVKVSCRSSAVISREVRNVFNLIYKALVNEGLKDMFSDVKISEQGDKTFLLLEDKR